MCTYNGLGTSTCIGHLVDAFYRSACNVPYFCINTWLPGLLGFLQSGFRTRHVGLPQQVLLEATILQQPRNHTLYLLLASTIVQSVEIKAHTP